MGDEPDAIAIAAEAMFGYPFTDEDHDDQRQAWFDTARDAFAALFAAAGVEGDGDIVLSRRDGRVTVAGRLVPHAAASFVDVYRIVPSPGGTE